MSISLKTKQHKTFCGGTVTVFISQNDSTARLTFNNVQQCPRCEECPFNQFCPILDKQNIHYIEVKAFTGMSIGVFPITRFSKLFIEVETRNKLIMRFDRTSGVQTNCNNSRFANRVDPGEIPDEN